MADKKKVTEKPKKAIVKVEAKKSKRTAVKTRTGGVTRSS